MNIILDLDNTLIYCITTSNTWNGTGNFSFTLGGVKYVIFKRPGLNEFLEFVYDHFKHVGIWTAAAAPYAHKIVNRIMTPAQQKRLSFIYTRKKLVNGVKDLTRIFVEHPEFKSNNTIILDDKREMIPNKYNYVPIPEWNGSP